MKAMTRSHTDALAVLDQAEIFDGDMTARDIITALERLRFRDGLLAIRLDREVRDFLVAALKNGGGTRNGSIQMGLERRK
jgi:hypothetical protein